MVQRYRATVEYDGHDYLGFQIQARGRTIQGELEKALERVVQQSVRVLGAGRTDAGVHATGQVIAFECAWRHSISDLQRALNAVLPVDIAVRELAPAPADFHPRFDAVWRCYEYTIVNQPVRSPRWQRYAWHVPDRLDLAAMESASQFLVGTHDFAAFGKPTQGESTLRQVLQVGWRSEGSRLIFGITANAFLYHMVRNIVGTLVRVGRGELLPEVVAALLEAGESAAAGPPAPACGLCLVRVEYAR